MKKISGFFLLFALILLLNGCDEWDDLVDSVSGSDDDSASTTTTAAATKTKAATSYETKFHHTTTGSSDGGKSLVLCPGQSIGFEKCTVGSVKIPRHSSDGGRETYWNMKEKPVGDIVCVKKGKSYKYKADKTIVYGKCK